MLQNILVLFIVLLCVFFIVKRFLKRLSPDAPSGCGSNCGCCSTKTPCHARPRNTPDGTDE